MPKKAKYVYGNSLYSLLQTSTCTSGHSRIHLKSFLNKWLSESLDIYLCTSTPKLKQSLSLQIYMASHMKCFKPHKSLCLHLLLVWLTKHKTTCEVAERDQHLTKLVKSVWADISAAEALIEKVWVEPETTNTSVTLFTVFNLSIFTW